MCLGVPGKVVERFEEHGILMGKVSFDGVVKKVCLDHVPEAEPGDYVLVHVGFALSRIDEDQARETFELLSQMGGLDEIRAPQTDS
jgi:hydrogenase expression/formation protein HypC